MNLGISGTVLTQVQLISFSNKQQMNSPEKVLPSFSCPEHVGGVGQGTQIDFRGRQNFGAAFPGAWKRQTHR